MPEIKRKKLKSKIPLKLTAVGLRLESKIPIQPSFLRSNHAIARTVLKALQDPKQCRLADRELGRQLGLSHKTIGRWRKKLRGGTVTQLSSKEFLSKCCSIARIHPVRMWQELDQAGMDTVRKAYATLHRVLFGGGTLPKWSDLPLPKPPKEKNKKVKKDGWQKKIKDMSAIQRDAYLTDLRGKAGYRALADRFPWLDNLQPAAEASK